MDATATLHTSLAPVAENARWAAAGTAWVLIGLSAIKLCVVPHVVVRELHEPKSCGSHGALLMALTLSCSEPHAVVPSDSGLAVFYAVHACAVLQSSMVLWYLGRCCYIRAPPVPFWFPATVGVGMSAIAGSRVGMALPLQLSFFCLSAGLCIVLWPWITCRLVQSDAVAPAPSVFILAAPVSLVGLAYFAVMWSAPFEEWATPGGSNASAELASFDSSAFDRDAGACVLFAASTVCALATLFFVWRRRGILAKFVEPARGYAHQEWAGLTFPLVATTSVAVLWEARVLAQPEVTQGTPSAASSRLRPPPPASSRLPLACAPARGDDAPAAALAPRPASATA